jgi:hypothetical protein
MARWADDLTPDEAQSLDALFHALSSTRPRGWSVVRGLRELVLRPAARGVGKFGVTILGGDIHVASHDRHRGIWTARQSWRAGPEAPPALLAWAQTVAAEPDGHDSR